MKTANAQPHPINILLAGIYLYFGVLGDACAEPQPKWEIGASIGVISIADYRGSENIQSRALVFPYIVYRSKLLRADRDGLRGLLFSSNDVELNISMNASLTTEADDNPLRQGMPELDPTFELGPALDINLTGESLREGWMLRLPLRAVVSFSEDGFHHVGSVFNPGLRWLHDAKNDWRIHFTGGLIYGNDRYHRYYYSVDPQFATPDRPVFQTSAGYSGFSNQITLTRHKNRFWYGGYLRYDNLSNAEFIRSPLVETDHYYAIGLAVGWVFAESETTAPY